MAWLPFINDYKPFYIQTTGDAAAWSTTDYGLVAKSNPYPVMPSPKEPYKNAWKDENGDDEYVTEMYYEAQTISVKFYPEGGDLIVGKKCRVAVLAVDDNGHPHEGEGFVMNEKGDVLAAVMTDSLGRGLFEVVPDEGTLVAANKVRGRKTALNSIVESIRKDLKDTASPEFLINHADCLDDAKYVMEKIKEAYPGAKVTISGLGVVIGAHCGPGLFTVFYMTDARRP